jgi:hypothetical protein
MATRTLEEKIAYLTDRAEISDVIGRYCYGMDSRDWELFRSCWTDEISLDFTDITLMQERMTNVRADFYVECLKVFFAHMPRSQHIKFPVRYDFDGEKAVVLSILQGKHWMPNSLGGSLQTVVGYYRDEFIRTELGWKMNGMKELVYWNEGSGHVLTHNLQKMIAFMNHDGGSELDVSNREEEDNESRR